MKNRALVLLLTVATIIASCASAERASEDLNLGGEWNLLNLSGGVAGFDIDYERGWIIWNFNEDTVLISNDSPIDNGPLTKASGTYNYDIIVANNNNYLVIDSQEMGEIIVDNDSFTIDGNEFSSGPANDGFGIYFER